MKEFLLTNIDQTAYLNECDVCLAMCEYYLKQWTMSEVYQEAGAATPPPQGQPAPTPSSDATPESNDATSQPQPGAATGGTPQPDQGQQNQAADTANMGSNGNIFQALQKLIEMLTKALSQFMQNQASQAAQQQNEQMENEIDQLKGRAQQQGTDLSNEQTVDKLVEEIAQPDEEDQEGLDEKQKKLTKCVLIGNFKDCAILSPASLEALNKINETLKGLIQEIKARTQQPEALANAIKTKLEEIVNDKQIAPLSGGTTQDNRSFSTTMQMNWKQFRENEKNAIALCNQAYKNLDVIDQQFRTGGLKGFMQWATSKDIRAQSVSKEALQALTKTLNVIRDRIGSLMREVQSVRKVNRKVIKKMRTICVGGNASYQNFGNRKSTQKAGVTSQMIARQDKGRFQNFQGNAMNQGYTAS